MKCYRIVEKDNKLKAHSMHDSLKCAERFLANVVPEYIKKGYYMDKTLTVDSFIIVEQEITKRRGK